MHSGVVYIERQRLYIHSTNNTYIPTKDERWSGEREKKREGGEEHVSV